MSGNSIRKRELQRKVLCSLLAAGVMSVCISGGDVWAAAVTEKIELSGAAASTSYDNLDLQVSNKGSFKGIYTYKGANLDFTGAVTNIKINTQDNVATAVANYGNNGGVMNFDANKTNIILEHTGMTGQGSRDMGLLVNQGTVNFNGDTLIKATTETTASVRGVDVECNTADASKSIVKFNKDAVIEVKTGDAATGIFVSGKPGSVDALGDSLTISIKADGHIDGIYARCGGTFTTAEKNNLNIDLQSEGSYNNVTGIKCWSEKEGNDDPNGGNIDIKGSATIKINSKNKAYGIRNEYYKRPVEPGKVKVAGDLNMTIVGDKAYGILSDNKDSDTDILGNVDINVTGQTEAYAVQAKSGAKVTLGSAGKTVNLTAGSNSGWVVGLKATGGSDITVNGEKLGLDLKSTVVNGTADDRITGIDGSANEGGKITINSANTLLTGVLEGSTVYSDGVRANMSTIDFNGNVAIDLKGENKQTQITGVNVQCDPSNSWDTAVNFNGAQTGIKVAAQASWLAAVQGSGVPGSINFTGEKVDLTAINTGSGEAVGIYSQYGATIKSDAVTNINATIQANSSAKGIYNTNNYGYNGNVKLNGSFTATVTSNAENAHGIYNDPLAEDSTGGSVLIGKNLHLQVNATKGDATGIYGGGKYSNTTVLGDTTIVANGEIASDALYTEDGGKITVGSAGKTVSLTGNVFAENSGVVTLAGDTNTVKGIVTADGGSVVLNGGEKATYAVDKFVTANSGKITVSGGTLNIDDLGNTNKFDLVDNSLEVTGKGVLQAAAKNIFNATGSSASKVADAVDAKVLFSGGKLAISDASYKLADSKAYSTALAAAEGNAAKTTLVMTGTLQQEDIPNNTAGVEDLAPTGAVHTQVTGTVESDTLNIGGAGTGSPDTGTSVNNDLGVKDLDFSGSGSTVESAKVNISNDTGLTLVGDGSGDLLKGTNGSNNTVTVGSTDSSGQGTAGTLTLGNTAAANSGGNLNAAVELGHNDSQMNVEAGSFKVDKITATAGTVAVNEGSALTTGDLTIGSSDTGTTGAVNAAGSVEVTGTLTVNKGTVAVSGSLAASELKASDGASIAVGASENAGTLTAKKVQLNGASIVLDPIWKGNDKITTASKAGLEFANSHQIDGKLTVGQNSVLSLGTTDISKAEEAFAATGLNWGQNDITAALYIDAVQTLDNSKGGIKVDGTLTHKETDTSKFAVANNAEFAANSLLMVTSAAASTTDGTANGALKANSGKLTVDAGAKLYIADAQAGQTYTVASGFSAKESSVDQKGWKGDNLLLNKLVTGTGNFDSNSGSFTVTTKKVKANEALPGVALPNILDAMTSNTTSDYAGVKYLSNAISEGSSFNTDAERIAAINSFAKGAENSGASHSSVLAAFDTSSIVQGHLSLANKDNEPAGGFGKAADRENNGGIWAQYLHNKDKSDAGYEGQYNGFVLGGDFADKGKYSSGVAFSYGSGDSTGSASKNEYDFWGLSYYGGIRNDDTNLIFDVGYSKNSSEIKGVVNADPDTQIITLGVKGEKMYTNGHGTKFVPYAGLRYMNVDTDSYTGTIDGKAAANYSPDKADLWLLPVGVSITNETVSESGWKVRPTADIAYVWTMGDNDNAMGITVPGINAQDRLGYELMDSGFFVGRLGLEAEKDDWTYGVSYSYQKGSDAQSNKWFVDVKYSF